MYRNYINKEDVLSMNEIKTKEDLVFDIVYNLYRTHDLSTTFYREEIEDIVRICMIDIKNHPSIPINKFFVIQTILENFKKIRS